MKGMLVAAFLIAALIGGCSAQNKWLPESLPNDTGDDISIIPTWNQPNTPATADTDSKPDADAVLDDGGSSPTAGGPAESDADTGESELGITTGWWSIAGGGYTVSSGNTDNTDQSVTVNISNTREYEISFDDADDKTEHNITGELGHWGNITFTGDKTGISNSTNTAGLALYCEAIPYLVKIVDGPSLDERPKLILPANADQWVHLKLGSRPGNSRICPSCIDYDDVNKYDLSEHDMESAFKQCINRTDCNHGDGTGPLDCKIKPGETEGKCTLRDFYWLDQVEKPFVIQMVKDDNAIQHDFEGYNEWYLYMNPRRISQAKIYKLDMQPGIPSMCDGPLNKWVVTFRFIE